MQSWRFATWRLPPILNTLIIVVPSTVAFAGIFFTFFEKPYMRKAVRRTEQVEEHRTGELTPIFVQNIGTIPDEA